MNSGLGMRVVNGSRMGKDELFTAAKRSEVNKKSRLGAKIGSGFSLDQVGHELKTLFGFEQILQFLLVHHQQAELLQVWRNKSRLV